MCNFRAGICCCAALALVLLSLPARGAVSCKDTANNAETLLTAGRYSEAYDGFEQAHACLLREAGDQETADSARLLNKLGEAANESGNYTRAKDLFAQALDALVSIHGTEAQPDAVESLLRLGGAAVSDGDGDTAEAYFQRVLSVSGILGEQGPRLHARAAEGLCDVLFIRGQYEDSLACIRDALAGKAAAFGDDDPETAQSWIELGVIAFNTGDYETAQQSILHAQDILTRTLGPEHPRMATVAEWLGYCRQAGGDSSGAIDAMTRALDIRLKTLGPTHPDTAQSYSALGYVSYVNENYSQARNYYAKALEMCRTIYGESHPLMANAYNDLALAEQDNGNLSAAADLYGKSLAIELALHGEDHPGTAFVYSNLAVLTKRLGQFDKSLEYGTKSLDIRLRTLGPDNPDLLFSHNALAMTLEQLGRYDEARTHLAESLRISLAVFGKEHMATATQYNNMGYLFEMLGDYGRAIDDYQQALDIETRLQGEQTMSAATINNNLGVACEKMGDNRSALTYHLKALDIAQALPGADSVLIALYLNNAGVCHQALNKPEKALEYFLKSLDIKRATLPPDHPDLGVSYGNISNAYDDMHDSAKALEYGLMQLEIYEKVFGENHPATALAISNLAPVYNHAGDPDKAVAMANRAVAALCGGNPFPSAADCTLSGTAITALRNGAVAYMDLDKPEQAVAYYTTAADMLDRVRASVQGEDSKAAHGAENYQMFPEGIGAFTALANATGEPGTLSRAVDFAERGIGRVFLEMLGRSRARIDGGLPPDVLAEGERLKANAGMAADVVAVEEGKPRAEQSQSARRSAYEALHQAEADLVTYNARLLADYPDYAELMNPTPRHFEDMAARLLPPHGAILEYYLGSHASYLIFISEKKIIIEPLPPAEEIEQLVDMHRVRLTSPGAMRTSLTRSGEKLYDVLLGKVADELDGVDSLLIVPTGKLYFLPFETLVYREDGAPRFLIQRFAIRYAPSLNVAYMVAQRKHKERDAAPALVWLGFGDPVYGVGDARSRGLDISEESDDMARAYSRALADNESAPDSPWLRLPGTGDEVKSIAGMFDPQAVNVSLGVDATEKHFKDLAARGSRFVHLAAHGSLGEGGAREPALVLSLVGNAGTGEDGFLTMSDVFNMKVRADLVVMSACKTGQGRMQRGEGVAGMARAFLYAGADSLLVSLWSVADEETRNLMVSFYDHLNAGEDSQTALRDVKLAFIEKDLHPFYWAPFVFLGGY